MIIPEHNGFRRSTYCDESGCVEVAHVVDGSAVLMRDSKIEDSPVLGFTPQAWHDFVAAIRDGEFG